MRNLLDGALGLGEGQSILIVIEPDDGGFYRDGIGRKVADIARARGGHVVLIEEPVGEGPESFPATVRDAMAQADHTVFFSRLGSQARFLNLPGSGTKTVSYALDAASLAAPFGTLPYGFTAELHDLVVARIARARSYTITCPSGTHLHMTLDGAGTGAGGTAAMTPFTVRNFPVMIFPPVSSERAHGRLALSLALLSTGIHAYENPELPLDSPLLVDIEAGLITGFSGDPAQAERARAHFDRVGRVRGADVRRVNSWHTGINPTTFFAGRAIDDLARWGSVAFGSPRYTHFHMVGADPGEICGSLFDATIRFDDEILWDGGRFTFLDRPEVVALAAHHGVPRGLLAASRSIGV